MDYSWWTMDDLLIRYNFTEQTVQAFIELPLSVNSN